MPWHSFTQCKTLAAKWVWESRSRKLYWSILETFSLIGLLLRMPMASVDNWLPLWRCQLQPLYPKSKFIFEEQFSSDSSPSQKNIFLHIAFDAMQIQLQYYIYPNTFGSGVYIVGDEGSPIHFAFRRAHRWSSLLTSAQPPCSRGLQRWLQVLRRWKLNPLRVRGRLLLGCDLTV